MIPPERFAVKQHFLMFARYNRWANERLFETVANLADEQYRADRGAFFDSVHGTLNHILVGDRAWMGRFVGKPEPLALDAILYEEFEDLRRARTLEDDRIVTFIEGRVETDFDAEISYTNSRSEANAQPLGQLLAHFFNHQTHHRGQTHTLISQLGYDAPSLDLIFFIRQG